MPGYDHERAALGETLAAAVREAGELALKTFRTNLKHWTKAKNSPVSEADMAVDALLKVRLATPGIGWLSEETEDDHSRMDAKRVWIVDPIDGTRAYIGGATDWSISAALIEDGRPIVAALYAPAENQFFRAIVGEGATCNGATITVSPGDGLAGARVTGPKRAVERLLAAEPTLVGMPRVHSLALRLARVAQGELDGAVAGGASSDWDLAAADLLVHEAHGLLTTFAGDPVVYNRPDPVHAPLIAASRARHQALRELLREVTT